MKHFLKVFLLFAVFGIFMLLSIALSAVITYCITSFLSIDPNEWGEIIADIVWLCFSIPLIAAILDKISDHFFPW